MLTRAFRRSCKSVTSTILEPDQIADWVSEQLTHDLILNLSGKSEAAQYDLSGNVMKRTEILRSKFTEKQLRSLMEHGKYLHLDKKGLDDFDILVVARTLRFMNQSCELLDVNGNPIGDFGFDHITKHVVPFTPLKSLFASGCLLSDTSISSLVGPWIRNDALSVLELRNNMISDKGAVELAEAILENKFEREITIYLSGNKISDEGAVALTKAVMSKIAPLKIWLPQNTQISQEAKDEIMKYTKNVRF